MQRREIAMQNLQSAFVVFLTLLIGVNCMNLENSSESDNETNQGTVDLCKLKCGNEPYVYCEGDQDMFQNITCICPIKTQVFDDFSLTCKTRCIKKCGIDPNIVCSGNQTTDDNTICGCKNISINWMYVHDRWSKKCLRCDCKKGENCTFDEFYQMKCEKCREGFIAVNGICKGDCSNSPCKNGGYCRIKGEDITCDCKYPFTGEFCEKSVHCDPNPCKNGGTCISAGHTFECACPDIYGGRNCSENIFCEKHGEGYCGEASCYVSENPTEVHCICGDDQVFDKVSRTCSGGHCDPNPCENGGTCISTGHTFECACPDTYEGRNCSENIFCKKYGEEYCGEASCYVSENSTEVHCICGDGQSFNRVSHTCRDDYCHPNPCKNGGLCLLKNTYYPGEDPYTCFCKSTHMGTNCTKSTWCRYNGRSVCGNEATCQYNEDSGEHSCICASGETFDEKLKICKGTCKPNPCVYGTCVKDGKYAYHCSCFPSYIGKYCDEEVIYPCTINPCQNGGTCSSYGPYYMCSCKMFHTGKNCERVDPNGIAVVIVPLGLLGIGLAVTVALIRRRKQNLKMIAQRMEAYRAIQNAMPVSR